MRRISRRRIEAAIDEALALMTASGLLAGAVRIWVGVVGPRI